MVVVGGGGCGSEGVLSAQRSTAQLSSLGRVAAIPRTWDPVPHPPAPLPPSPLQLVLQAAEALLAAMVRAPLRAEVDAYPLLEYLASGVSLRVSIRNCGGRNRAVSRGCWPRGYWPPG